MIESLSPFALSHLERQREKSREKGTEWSQQIHAPNPQPQRNCKPTTRDAPERCDPAEILMQHRIRVRLADELRIQIQIIIEPTIRLLVVDRAGH